ncbi:lmo0937 family membrane protein [Listeria sp. FSL L7-1582]|uniref:Lmo0937 family membrane protein n=1 Tax=Listeria rustica TaxID=2713503 RepID=A0A7W1T4Z7_9LIST|nr:MULTISPECIES: lmo0937 family membrane protein [Listeria]MBA3925612.1 lmo0937 family membrane protein [Listeria rustica]MBC6310285.1 lmo0937 family membrane protein [Listeria portnoyi]
MAGILWTVIVVLFVLWVLGLILRIGGKLIHLLLVVAVILLVWNLITGMG